MIYPKQQDIYDVDIFNEDFKELEQAISKETLDRQTSLAKKADTSHTHDVGDINGLDNTLNEKADKSHTHEVSDIKGLDNAIDTKIVLGNTKTSTEDDGSLSPYLNLVQNGKVKSSRRLMPYEDCPADFVAKDGEIQLDIREATTTQKGLLSAEDKKKLDNAGKVAVDSELDESSENPVQNKAIKAELDKKANVNGNIIYVKADDTDEEYYTRLGINKSDCKSTLILALQGAKEGNEIVLLPGTHDCHNGCRIDTDKLTIRGLSPALRDVTKLNGYYNEIGLKTANSALNIEANDIVLKDFSTTTYQSTVYPVGGGIGIVCDWGKKVFTFENIIIDNIHFYDDTYILITVNNHLAEESLNIKNLRISNCICDRADYFVETENAYTQKGMINNNISATDKELIYAENTQDEEEIVIAGNNVNSIKKKS